ncbi:MAG: DNA methyltransferase [Microscillaceae bacterium]|nr:DNA methyltransferase [Microscillaceae bacterium]MDW8461193.1 DNA methyltransferase [Cytophagales bacterium]
MDEIIKHPIKPEKQKAWHWRMHQYFTKQAANVVATYIEHHTREGDTVLDPFGGTGVTAIEALRLRRKVVILDINPLACFITRQTCEQIDIQLFKQTFEQLEQTVKPQIEAFYRIPNEDLAKQAPQHWYPKNIPLPKNADFEFVHQLYTPRQLHSYALLFAEILKIENPQVRNMMKYVFTATMAKVNVSYLQNDRGLEGGASSILVTYRYHKPKKLVELDVWKNFSMKFGYIYQGKEKWNELTKGFNVAENLEVIHGSVLELSQYLPEQSIDYIYTDPPYGGNIAYLDLSTMWNAWLFPEIFETQKIETLKQNEVIEGGDLEKTQQNYTELLAKSFEEMSKVLKKDGWLSCVFAHKKLEFWNVIVESCEANGMEFRGSTYQPTNNSSMHYKKNPANVLCSQRIANFKKTFVKRTREKPDDLQQFILNEVERTCLEMNGATLDMIYNRVLDKLLNNLLGIEAKKRSYINSNKILNLLQDADRFTFNETENLYYVKGKEHDDDIREQYFARRNELRIFLRELLTLKKGLTIDEIHKEIFEIFADDKKFPIEKDLPSLLEEIAVKSPKTNKWLLKQGEVMSLDFGQPAVSKLVKVNSTNHTHSEIIFRLVKIGEYLGFRSWVGKREQSIESFQGIKLSEISLSEFPLQAINADQKAKIEQIDVIWFDKLGFPRYGFEVEESTSILSGFERFMNLLEVQPDISQKLYIVCPKSRAKKLQDVFKKSTYVGHPLYLENKVGYIYCENLVKFYDKHIEKPFKEKDLKILYEFMK